MEKALCLGWKSVVPPGANICHQGLGQRIFHEGLKLLRCTPWTAWCNSSSLIQTNWGSAHDTGRPARFAASCSLPPWMEATFFHWVFWSSSLPASSAFWRFLAITFLEHWNRYQDKAVTLHRITTVPLLPPYFELAGLRSLRIHADTTLATELLKVSFRSSVDLIHFPIQTLLLGSDMWLSWISIASYSFGPSVAGEFTCTRESTGVFESCSKLHNSSNLGGLIFKALNSFTSAAQMWYDCFTTSDLQCHCLHSEHTDMSSPYALDRAVPCVEESLFSLEELLVK